VLSITKVTINNFLSVGSIELNLPLNGLLLIEGWNHDDQRANGAGKTAIFNAICWCLYGKLPRGISATEVIRAGAKTCEVSLEVLVEGQSFIIRRRRPTFLALESPDGKVLADTQLAIDDLIKLTYDQFISSVYNAQNSEQRFLMLNDSDRKKLLLRMLRLDDIDHYYSFLKEDQKKQFNRKTDAEGRLNKIVGAVKQANNNLANLRSFVPVLDLKTLKDRLASQEANLLELSTLENDLKVKLEKLIHTASDLRDRFRHTAASSGRLASINKNISEVETDIAQMRASLVQKRCNQCQQLLNNQDSINHIQQAIDNKLNTLAKLQVAKVEHEKMVDEHDRIKKLLDKAEQKLTKTREELNAATNAKLTTQSTINTIKADIQLSESYASAIHKAQDEVNLLKQEEKLATQEFKEAVDEFSLLEEIAEIMGPSGIKAYAISSIVPLINMNVAKHLSVAWPSMSYELMELKEKADGNIVAKFNDVITMSGRNISFGSLSGGEQRALALCVDAAIIDVISQITGVNISPIMLDEPFDGLDYVGREAVMQIISNLSSNRLIMVIDHATELKALFDRCVTIEKRSGISYIT
jgi:DNA repair exonuclease SbcCD ATPase subunit